MNTQIVTFDQVTNDQKITSIEIATLIGKPHNDLLKAIRKMEPAWEVEHLGKFSQMQIQEELPNGGYRLRPCYVLTKTESLFVATKFNDVARARLVLRWEQLECEHMKQPQIIQPLLETEEEIMKRSDAIRRQQIEIENASADGCYTTREIAKSLDMTIKELNKRLVEGDVLFYNEGRYKLKPYYENKELTQERSFHYFALDGEKKQRVYLVWTLKGVVFIKNLINKQLIWKKHLLKNR